MHNKKSRQVLQHQGGKGKTFIIILPLLRGAVKLAATAAGIYMAVAIAALNWPALVAAILTENVLIGAYFKLEVWTHEDVQRL